MDRLLSSTRLGWCCQSKIVQLLGTLPTGLWDRSLGHNLGLLVWESTGCRLGATRDSMFATAVCWNTDDICNLCNIWQYPYRLMCCILYHLIVKIQPYQGHEEASRIFKESGSWSWMMPSTKCVPAIHTSIAPFLFQTAFLRWLLWHLPAQYQWNDRGSHIFLTWTEQNGGGVAAATHLRSHIPLANLVTLFKQFYNFP